MKDLLEEAQGQGLQEGETQGQGLEEG